MSSKKDLIALCKEKKIKGYTGKSKDELVKLLEETTISTKSTPFKTTQGPLKSLGQYFTISNSLQQFVFDNVKNKNELLLEPSFGAGHLLKKFKEYNQDYPMHLYEIDTTVKPILEFNENQLVTYADFTSKKITKKYKTIIGNPPYVKQSTGNLYIKFIELCYNYLDDNGELIFIVPSDFIKLTSAASIIKKMTESGSFTDFLFPHDENLFEGASVDVLVFRYEKGSCSQKSRVISNGVETLKYCNVSNGIITFSDNEIKGVKVEELFDVYVGLVSGKDEVYKVPIGNIEVLVDKDRVENFIYTETFPTENEEINNHLLKNKEELLERKIKKFTEKNWYEWGAPRNIRTIQKCLNQPCIYVKNMTRNKEVAFIGKVQYFGGTLLCLIPKAKINLEEIVQYMNTEIFQRDYMYAGRFKIGHKQLSNANLECL